MKTLRVFWILTLIVFTVGMVTANTMKTHKDKAGFSISYPSDWKIQKNTGDISVSFSSKDYMAMVTVGVYDNGGGMSAVEFSESMLDKRGEYEMVDNLKKVSVSKMNGDNGAMYKVSYATVYGNTYATVLVIIKSDKVFVVSWYVNADSENKYNTLLNKIVKSFKIRK